MAHKLSYIHKMPMKPYNYNTITGMAENNAVNHPDQEIFIHRRLDWSRSSITNASLFKQSYHLATFLVSEGVRKGDTVALIGPNTLETIVGTLGIMFAGAVVLNISIVMKKAEDAQELIHMTDTRYVLIDCGENEELLPVIEVILDRHKCQEATRELKVVFLRSVKIRTVANIKTLPEILSMSKNPYEMPNIYPEDSVIVFSSSGSTGSPKLVLHTHFSLCSIPFSWTPTETDDEIVQYNDRPFVWIGGSPIINILIRKPRVFMDASVAAKSSNASLIWRTIKEEHCTDALLSPYVVLDFIHLPVTHPKDEFMLRHIATGGQMIDDICTQLINRYCQKIVNVLGTTETFGIAMQGPVGFGEKWQTGDFGSGILPGVEMRIVDDRDLPALSGTVGRIQIRGPSVMKEYFRNHQLNEESFTADRWFTTGDVGKITPEGKFRLLGREKDIISRGTNKIYPAMLESLIKEIHAVRYVSVIAVPDKRLYEEICVCFVAHSSSNLTPEKVQEECKNKLLTENTQDGIGAMPKYFLAFDEFPFLGNGKPDKIALSKEAILRLGFSVKSEK